MAILKCFKGKEIPFVLTAKKMPEIELTNTSYNTVENPYYCNTCSKWGYHAASTCKANKTTNQQIIDAVIVEPKSAGLIDFFCTVCKNKINEGRTRALIILKKPRGEFKCFTCEEDAQNIEIAKAKKLLKSSFSEDFNTQTNDCYSESPFSEGFPVS